MFFPVHELAAIPAEGMSWNARHGGCYEEPE